MAGKARDEELFEQTEHELETLRRILDEVRDAVVKTEEMIEAAEARWKRPPDLVH